MNLFKIPNDKLRHFLVTLNMNFNLKDPEYIFQSGDFYDVILGGTLEKHIVDTLDQLVESYSKEKKKELNLIKAASEMVGAIDVELSETPTNCFPQIFYCRQNLEITLRQLK